MRKHGFAITFRTGRQNERILVTGVLTHRAGHSEETTMDLPVDAGPGRNAVQAIGSSTSYGKRYAAAALLNFVSGTERDDGTAGGGEPVVSDEQADTLRKLITDQKVNVDQFTRFFGIESVPDLPATRFDEAVRMINQRARNQQGGR